MRYLMTLSYDGTNFSGYQKQVKERTVQGELEKVLKQINDNKKVEVHATGRTDAKVHAINQKAHFDMDTNIPIDKLMKGINSLLPEDIYVKKIENVSEDFHARFNALGKEYIYIIPLFKYQIFSTKITFYSYLTFYTMCIYKFSYFKHIHLLISYKIILVATPTFKLSQLLFIGM